MLFLFAVLPAMLANTMAVGSAEELQFIAAICGLESAPIEGDWIRAPTHGVRLRAYSALPPHGALLHTFERAEWLCVVQPACVVTVPADPRRHLEAEWGLNVGVRIDGSGPVVHVNISRGTRFFPDRLVRNDVVVPEGKGEGEGKGKGKGNGKDKGPGVTFYFPTDRSMPY